jgi:hypothetical protein
MAIAMAANYHISRKDLGQDIVLKPRVPSSSVISKEGNIPRVCVSSHPVYCLRSIVGTQEISIEDILYAFYDMDNHESLSHWKNRNGLLLPPAIYQSFEQPFLPPHASDFRRNKEQWYLKKTPFSRVGYLNLRELLSGRIKIIDSLDDYHYPYTYTYTYTWSELNEEFGSNLEKSIALKVKKIKQSSK